MITFNTCQLSFKAKLIDAHAHVGKHEHITYTKDMLDVFVKQPLPNNDTVEMMLVSDTDTFKGLVNEYDGNKNALQSFNNDKSYAFFASCSPKNGNVQNIQKLMNEFPDRFVGLKFHPNDNKLPVTDSKYEPYFEYANRNKIPCMFHTQVPVDNDKGGVLFRLPDGSLDTTKLDPFSDPEAIYTVAKKYKDAPFVMAHMGGGWNESHDRAIDVLVQSVKNGDANLYADISWVDIDAPHGAKPHIIEAIKKLKGIGDPTWDKGDQSFRLMFGTDAPIARFQEDTAREKYVRFVDDIKDAIKNDADLAKDSEKIIEDLFYNNAKKLFFPPKQSVTTSATAAATRAGGSKAKIIAGVLSGALAIAGGICIAKNKKSSENKL